MKKWWAIIFVIYLIGLAFIESFQTRIAVATVFCIGIIIHGLYKRRIR